MLNQPHLYYLLQGLDFAGQAHDNDDMDYTSYIIEEVYNMVSSTNDTTIHDTITSSPSATSPSLVG